MVNIEVTNAKTIGEENLKWFKVGEEVDLKVTASGFDPDSYLVEVIAEGSFPDFSQTIATIPADDVGRVDKTFNTVYDFPGNEDVIFKARLRDKTQTNVYRSGSTTSTEKIYSDNDEKIAELLQKQKEKEEPSLPDQPDGGGPDGGDTGTPDLPTVGRKETMITLGLLTIAIGLYWVNKK